MNKHQIRDRIAVLAETQPSWPRLWSGQEPVSLGEGWQLKEFQHDKIPLWVTLISPGGRYWETFVSQYSRCNWAVWRRTIVTDDDGNNWDAREDVDMDTQSSEAEAALFRLLQMMEEAK